MKIRLVLENSRSRDRSFLTYCDVHQTKEKTWRKSNWFYSSVVELMLRVITLKNEFEFAVDCGGAGFTLTKWLEKSCICQKCPEICIFSVILASLRYCYTLLIHLVIFIGIWHFDWTSQCKKKLKNETYMYESITIWYIYKHMMNFHFTPIWSLNKEVVYAMATSV